MANENQIEVQIVLDDGSVQRGFANIQKQADNSAKSIGASFSTIVTGVVAGATAIAAAFGVGLRKAISEASQAEQAYNALGSALAVVGKATEDNINSATQYASQLQKITGISDDIIIQNQALLVSLGGLSGDGLNRATKAALDLAQALQIDIGTAFDLVAKESTGSTGALSRYGIKIDENTPKNEKFAKTLELIEQRFGGLSESRLNTLSGQVDAIGASFNDVFEEIGKLVTQSTSLRVVISEVRSFFDSLIEPINQFGKQNPLDALILGIVESAILFNQAFGPIIEVFSNVFSFIFNLVSTTGNAIISGIADFLGAFADIAEKLGSNNPLIKSLQQFRQDSQDIAATSGQALRESFGNIFDTTTSENTDSFLNNLKTKLQEAGTASSNFKNQVVTDNQAIGQSYITLGESFKLVGQGISDSVQQLNENASKNFKALGASALQGFAGAVSQSFAAFGKALAEGRNAFEAFGQAFLGILGGILVQLGTGYILQGIAASANPLTPGAGGPLIAAGIGLSTFGGILQALGSSQGAASAQSAGVGGGVAAGGGGLFAPTTPIAENENITQQEPQTQIAVNIQGDVLDSQDTGLRIVSLLKDAFETTDARVTGLT